MKVILMLLFVAIVITLAAASTELVQSKRPRQTNGSTVTSRDVRIATNEPDN